MEKILSNVEHVGVSAITRLMAGGVTTVDQLADMNAIELAAMVGVDTDTAAQMIASAQVLLASVESGVGVPVGDEAGETGTPVETEEAPVAEEPEKISKKQRKSQKKAEKKVAKQAQKTMRKVLKQAKKEAKRAEKTARKVEKKVARQARKALKKAAKRAKKGHSV